MAPDLRSLTLEDAPAVVELLAARNAVDFGRREPDFTPEELREWWAAREEDLAGRSWLALDGERAVGFAKLHLEGDCAELDDDSCVHPDWRGQGIGTALIERLEGWARRHGLGRVRAGVVNDGGRALLVERSYELVRHFWRMEVVHRAEPPRPAAVPGVLLRGYRPREDDADLHAAIEEAFEDHWEHAPSALGEWIRSRHRRTDYHPELWVVAEADGEIAGAATAFGARDFGWVLDLGVRRPWRGRGVGQALLSRCFGELYRHGLTRVGLEVDAASETGATRLYERAGMRVTRRYDWYERAL